MAKLAALQAAAEGRRRDATTATKEQVKINAVSQATVDSD